MAEQEKAGRTGPWKLRHGVLPHDLIVEIEPTETLREATASFALRIFNAHDDLVEALEQVRAFMIPGMNWTDDTGQHLKLLADAALAKARPGAGECVAVLPEPNIDGHGIISQGELRANWLHIERACNTHDDLMKALSDLLTECSEGGQRGRAIDLLSTRTVSRARAALAKARP